MASNSYKSEIDKLKQVIKIQDPPLDKVDDPDRLAAVRTKFYVSKKFYKKVGFYFLEILKTFEWYLTDFD